MLDWLRRRMGNARERKTDHLVEGPRQWKEQIKRETGKPIELTDKERTELAILAVGIDPEYLARLSVLGTDKFLPSSNDAASIGKQFK